MKWLLCDSTGKGARFFSPSKTYWLQLASTFYCADNISEFAHSIFSLLIETVMWSHLCSARDPHSALVKTAPVESCESCSDMARCVTGGRKSLPVIIIGQIISDRHVIPCLTAHVFMSRAFLTAATLGAGKNICKHVKQLRTLERERNQKSKRKRINLKKFHVQ